MKNDDAKFRTVFHALCDAIDAGEFAQGQRMPSEKALAERFEVSLPTIRRAGQDLVAMGMLEKRGGDGTYVRPDNDEPGSRCVHFLYGKYDAEIQRHLVRLVREEALRRGISCRTGSCEAAEFADIVRKHIRRAIPTLVLGDSLLGDDAITLIGKYPGLFVVISNRLDHLGIPSVVGNDYAGIEILMKLLHNLGHRRIGLLFENNRSPIEAIQMAMWKSCCRGSVPRSLEFNANVPPGGSPPLPAQRVVEAQLRESGVTALIALNNQLAIGALRAARKLNLEVPRDLSVVSFYDFGLGPECERKLSGLDCNYPGHIEQAFELLLGNGSRNAPELLRVIEPAQIEGDTVSGVSAPNRIPPGKRGWETIPMEITETQRGKL